MLSFYLLADSAPKPSQTKLNELPKAGELSADDFAQLQEQRIIESRISSDQDFRWSSGVVNMKLQLLLHRYPQLTPTGDGSTPEQRLFVLLLNASAANAGLLAITD